MSVATAWRRDALRPVRAALLLAAIAASSPLIAAQLVLNGPAGSGSFGTSVFLLPDGKFLVTDPGYDAPGPIADVGAVYVYRPDGVLLITLRGSTASDTVGGEAPAILSNGNVVIRSPNWDNAGIVNAGAATFLNVNVPFNGTVSSLNSLVGSHANDAVSTGGVTALSNGNYVVRSPSWDSDTAANVGAATFGSGSTGIAGPVSASNSLVGSTANDQVSANIDEIGNSNYVVRTTNWNNGGVVSAGAATFGSGTNGVVGPVSVSNSLVGTNTNDLVGRDGIVALPNGRYLVRSSLWDNGAIANAGAVSFAAADGSTVGPVSALNSLIGSSISDSVGGTRVLVLSNGNYVVNTSSWDNGAVVNVGAVTFGSGVSGIVGTVSASNSLVGSTAGDRVGLAATGVAEVSGGYVVCSPFWSNGAATSAGAVTFASKTSGLIGPVSGSNSLVGTTANDNVGVQLVVLPNGNYVVPSTQWDNGTVVDAGAVTFASGVSGRTGVISQGNSLVGSAMSDLLSSYVVPLSNGSYVVASAIWDNGAIANAGAVTFVPSSGSLTGLISPSNSLVGTSADDRIGDLVLALANGDYLASSKFWDNGSTADVGAVAHGSGVSGLIGVVSPSTALIGSTSGDLVGNSLVALTDGSYLVGSPDWDNGSTQDVGAVTRGASGTGIVGLVSASNSLIGSSSNDRVGDGVDALSNGNALVRSLNWANGAALQAGAATYLPSGAPTLGTVSPSNSLVGGTTNDRVGSHSFGAIVIHSNGNAVLSNSFWSNTGAANAGAVSLVLASPPSTGLLTVTNSVLGTVASAGITQAHAYDVQRNQLIVGQRASNRVVLHRPGAVTSTSIVGDSLDPSALGIPVTFTATVISSPTAPNAGQVTFRAESGETCVDNTPTATGPTTADFSCQIVFVTAGTTNVIAEYTGSNSFAYSGSAVEQHTAFQDAMFANGFE